MGAYNSRRYVYKFKFDKEKTNDLAYIVGVILGDGCLSNNMVELASIDKEFVENFAAKLYYIFKRKPKVRKIAKTGEKKFIMGSLSNCKIQYKCRLNCKNIAKLLRDRVKNLNWIKTQKEKANFLKGLWDSDGSIDKKGYHLRFCNTNKRLLQIFERLSKEFGLCAYVSDDTHVSIRRKRDIAKFYKLMSGATIKRKNIIFIDKFGKAIQRFNICA